MKKFSKTKSLLAATIVSLSCSASVNAAGFNLNSWGIDFSGVDGIGDNILTPGNNTVAGITEMNFLAVGVSTTGDANSNGLPDVNETFSTVASGSITQLTGTAGAIDPLNFNQAFNAATAAVLGNSFEMTFTFEVSGLYTNIDATDVNFTHLAAGQGGTTGELKFYIDKTTGGSLASLGANTGVTDGVHVATFLVKAGDGGVFDFLNSDGSDDATFELDWVLPNVWTDENGLALTPGSVLGFTDSNFDGNPNNTGPFTFSPTGHNCGTKNAVNFCFQEDGSFKLGNNVPEPANIALIGIGLLGFGAFYRRKVS